MKSLRARLAAVLCAATGCASWSACAPQAKPADALKPWYLAVADAPAVLNETNTMTEDAEGNVWFGGAGGVVRFDVRENQWRVFSTPDGLGELHAADSASDDTGVLFAGVENITRYDLRSDRWSTVDTQITFPVLATVKGWPIYVYERSSTSVFRYDAASGGLKDTGLGEHFTVKQVREGISLLSVSPVDGSVWVLTNNQRLIRYSETTNPAVQIVRVPQPLPIANRMLVSSDGYVWLGIRDTIIRYDVAKQEVRNFPVKELAGLFADREGRACMISERQVLRFEASSGQWIPLFALSGEIRAPVLFARDGRTWGLGPEGSSVLDASRQKWTTVRGARSLPGNHVDALGSTGGRNGFVWASTSHGVATGPSRTSSFGFRAQMFSPRAWVTLGMIATDLLYGVRGTLVGDSGFGLYVKTSSDRARRFRSSIRSDYAIDDERHRLWIVDGGNLHVCDIRDEKSCREFIALERIGVDKTARIFPGRNGTIWFATRNALVQFRPSQGERYEIARYAGVSNVTALFDEADGMVWFATARLDRASTSGPSINELFVIASGQARRPPLLRVDIHVSEITKDDRGHLWLTNSRSDVVRFDVKSKETTAVSIPSSVSGSTQQRVVVDWNGRIWFVTDRGISRQEWMTDGTPKRPHTFSTTAALPRLSAVATSNGATYRWETRQTGLMRTGPTGAKAVPYRSDAGDLLVLVGAPNGGAWLAQTDNGLSFYHLDGRRTDIDVKDGLPDSTVRDISLVPGTRTPRAWVATDAGAAFVTDSRVEGRVTTDGPVDAIASLSDGSAWLAFNQIAPELYLDPSIANRRQRTYLQRVDTKSKLGTRVELPKGDILDLAASPDDSVVWVGTTAGLYRLDVATSRLDIVTSKGRLQPQAVPRLVVEPTGSVWMAANAPNADSFASIVGYDPSVDDVQVYTVDRGLPRARTIDTLDVTPEGHLVAEADGRIVYGAVYVPPQSPTLWIVLIALLSGAGAGQAIRVQRARKAAREAYRPLSELVNAFFVRAGYDVQRLDHRTVKVQARAGNESSVIVCALGDLLPVQEVMNAYERIRREAGSDAFRAYLAYPREIDPAATRQLDVYRLRKGAVIIPISGTFMRAKLEEGEEKPRGALDGLNRRYLGFQDLFDVKNAIDEPRFFFGRRALLGDLEQALNRREHVAIVGARKAGKSSLMNLLQQRLESFPVAKIDFQIYQRDDETWPAKFLARIIESYDAWGRVRFGSRWQTHSLPDGPLTGPVFRQALVDRRDGQIALTGNSQPLVILLDEIERVFPYGHEQDAGVGTLVRRAERYIATMGILRALGQEEGNRLVSIVVTDLKLDFNRVNAFDIRGIDTNPFYRFFQERFLTPLNQDECLEMVTEIGHAMGLTVDPAVQQRIFADSGGHVALARQLGSSACRKRAGSQTLTLAHYEDGLASLDEETGDLDVYFAQNFWHVSSTIERGVLRCGSSDDGATDEGFHAFASSEGLPVDGTLEARRHFLTTGMLERIGDRRYRVAGQLFRHWLARKTDSAVTSETI